MKAEQLEKLKYMLLNVFEYKDVAVREVFDENHYKFEIRIQDMIFVQCAWQTIIAQYKIGESDLYHPAAIVGHLAYLLDIEKKKVAA